MQTFPTFQTATLHCPFCLAFFYIHHQHPADRRRRLGGRHSSPPGPPPRLVIGILLVGGSIAPGQAPQPHTAGNATFMAGLGGAGPCVPSTQPAGKPVQLQLYHMLCHPAWDLRLLLAEHQPGFGVLLLGMDVHVEHLPVLALHWTVWAVPDLCSWVEVWLP